MKSWITMLVVGVAVVGCGKEVTETVAEVATEVATEAAASADGGSIDVDIDSDGGTLTITTPDGEAFIEATDDGESIEVQTPQGSLVVGAKAEIPEDYPKDVPLPEGFEPQMVSFMGSQGAYVLSGVTSQSVEEIQTLYTEKAPKEGWTQGTLVTQTQMTMIVFEKDGRTLQITAAADRDGKTGLSITTAAARK